jgi:capsular polysaccharide biosynthesis protein
VEPNVENSYPEEISLREIIEILLKGWKLIAAVTLIAVLISAVVSFFIIEPVYETSVGLKISATGGADTSQSEGISGILNSVPGFMVPTLDTYKERVKNPAVLKDVLDELGGRYGKLTEAALAAKINVEAVTDDNLIRVTVKDSDPMRAADIANSLAVNFAAYASAKDEEQALAAYQYIEEQANTQKEKLNLALAQYSEFVGQPGGVQELQAEIDGRLLLITDYTVQYAQKEVEENAKKAALDTMQKELAGTDKMLIIMKNLSDQSPDRTGQLTMEEQQINPNYLALENSLFVLKSELAMLAAEKRSITAQLDRNTEKLASLQAELAEKQQQESILKRNLELSQETYDSFHSKYEAIRIAQSIPAGQDSITIAAPAVEPTAPVAPRRSLNVAIAAVLGLMVSVFIVFIKDYWDKTGRASK